MNILEKHRIGYDFFCLFFWEISRELTYKNPEYISLWLSLKYAASLPVIPSTNHGLWLTYVITTLWTVSSLDNICPVLISRSSNLECSPAPLSEFIHQKSTQAFRTQQALPFEYVWLWKWITLVEIFSFLRCYIQGNS